MKHKQFSVKHLCLLISAGTLFLMMLLTLLFSIFFQDKTLLLLGVILIFCALTGFLLLIVLFSRKLLLFTNELCATLDNMVNGDEPLEKAEDTETLSARIHHRLFRLYRVLQENRRKVDKERQALQMLLSDISHQVKTPVANLRMVTDTLLSRSVSEEEQVEFLQGIRSQTDKLDFLFQSLVKTSRLETGAIQLKKQDTSLFNTLAVACSGIVYAAEQKEITVTVDCQEALTLPHDSKWTAEALFNLLDNGVKYTPPGGSITVTVEQWELYVKISIADTGRGIPESHQATIFQRFYREPEVHDLPGVGIGLYLAREIITLQGGYIQVSSEVGKGSVFSVFLPIR